MSTHRALPERADDHLRPQCSQSRTCTRAEHRVTHDRGKLHVTVPEDTSAQLDLPDGTSHLVEPGAHQHTWRIGR